MPFQEDEMFGWKPGLGLCWNGAAPRELPHDAVSPWSFVHSSPIGSHTFDDWNDGNTSNVCGGVPAWIMKLSGSALNSHNLEPQKTYPDQLPSLPYHCPDPATTSGVAIGCYPPRNTFALEAEVSVTRLAGRIPEDWSRYFVTSSTQGLEGR